MESNTDLKNYMADKIVFNGGEKIITTMEEVFTELKEKDCSTQKAVEFLAKAIEMFYLSMMRFVRPEQREKYLMQQQVLIFSRVLEHMQTGALDDDPKTDQPTILQ